MKRLAIVYGTDGDYIKEVLSFFQLREMQRRQLRHSASGRIRTADGKTHSGGEDRKFIAAAWGGAEDKSWRVWSVNDRFEIEEEIPDSLPAFEEAIILNLPASAEQSLHRKIADFLQKRQVTLFNPYAASRKADNKCLTISKLAAKNIPVPESILLRKSDSVKIVARLSAILARHKASGFYIQPNEGTEGRETYFFSSREFERFPELAAEIISGILRDREVIVKKARGNVFYYKKSEKERGYRSVTFRVFLWQPEDEVEADLGFAEITASENEFITSPEMGGRIITPVEAMANLYYREADAFRRIVLSDAEKRSLSESAARALAAFNSGLRQKLRIAGVDLVLEVTGGKVRPVVLEINPRPSGLDKLAEFGLTGANRRLPT